MNSLRISLLQTIISIKMWTLYTLYSIVEIPKVGICCIYLIHNLHTLLPAIETTDVIGNTENKQVKRNMSKYFQRMFMLISLSLGYLFYDTYSYFL